MIERTRAAVLLGLLGSALIPLVTFTSVAASGRPPSLQAIHELAAGNEAAAGLIKMNHTLYLGWRGDEFSAIRGGLAGDTLKIAPGHFTHITGVWAQDGTRQYVKTDRFEGADQPPISDVAVLDGEVMKWAKLPDLMEGAIADISKFDWQVVAPVTLGIRLFGGQCPLSELLVPDYASIDDDMVTMDGVEACVVNARAPLKDNLFCRIWLDPARGVPLRIEYYGGPPASVGAKPASVVEITKLHQLPNGGWIPVEGTRTTSFSFGERTSRIEVDVESITIRREDIPESLFTLTFPAEATVYNDIIGYTSGPAGLVGTLQKDLERAIRGELDNLVPQDDIAQVPREAAEPDHQPAREPSGEDKVPPTREGTQRAREADSAANRGWALARALLGALLAAFALTLVAWMTRHRWRTGSEGDGR